MVFCDISNAFDRVWHDGLIYKLKHYGFRNNISDWLYSYLHERKQCVVLNNTKSSYMSVRAGVPQGSVLGPLLFLIYINDISDNLSCLTRLFADDSSLSSSSTDLNLIETEINSNLDRLHQWAKDWLVIFNPNKTDAMLFTNRLFTQYPHLEFGNTVLNFVEIHKHLGVTLSFKWKMGRSY